jgi:hypothetical protein
MMAPWVGSAKPRPGTEVRSAPRVDSGAICLRSLRHAGGCEESDSISSIPAEKSSGMR